MKSAARSCRALLHSGDLNRSCKALLSRPNETVVGFSRVARDGRRAGQRFDHGRQWIGMASDRWRYRVYRARRKNWLPLTRLTTRPAVLPAWIVKRPTTPGPDSQESRSTSKTSPSGRRKVEQSAVACSDTARVRPSRSSRGRRTPGGL